MKNKSVILGLVMLTGTILALTGCNSMHGMKDSEMTAAQHPAGCMCDACKMKAAAHPAGCTCDMCKMKKQAM